MSDIFPISFMLDSSNLVADQLSGATCMEIAVLLCLARDKLCIRSYSVAIILLRTVQ
jgi:hypothetical protein